jgi:hypothetical protein
MSIWRSSSLFFSRWHVGDEPWPDFSDRSTWYPIYVLKGANAVTESTYPQQYTAMNEVYRILGVQSSVKTQLGRKQASTAENKGASASSVDRQGHWATKSRVGAYAKHSIPFDCVRVLAGFGPEPGRYYLPRALLSPPDSLQRKIFPQLETSKAKMLQNGSEIAGGSLMDLLQYMRTVILQDAVILLDAKYSHPLLDHPIFASPEFRVFSDQLIQAIKSTPQPEVLLLQQTVPLISENLREIRSQMTHSRTSIVEIKDQLLSIQQSVAQSSCNMNQTLQQNIGRLLVHAGSSMQESAMPSSDDVEELSPRATEGTTHASAPPMTSFERCERFTMSRQLVSVRQAWCEYTQGLPPLPSIREVEATCGAQWRCNNRDTQFYCR